MQEQEKGVSTTVCDNNNGKALKEDVQGQQEEEITLRQMWQRSEDPEEKRDLRSRMLQLREDRLKEFYGRDGQEILDSILKGDKEESPDGGRVTTSSTIGESHSLLVTSMSVSSSEIQSGEDKRVTSTSTSSVKTASSVSSSVQKSQKGMGEDLNQIKNRISGKDRSVQLKKIEEQKNQMEKRRGTNSPSSTTTISSSSSRRKQNLDEEKVNVQKISQIRNSSVVSRSKGTTNNSRHIVDHDTQRNGAKTKGGDNANVLITNRKEQSIVSTRTANGKNGPKIMKEDMGKMRQISTSITNTVTSSNKTKTTNSTVRSSSSMMITTTGTATTTMSRLDSSNKRIDGMERKGRNNRTQDDVKIPIGTVRIEEIVEQPKRKSSKPEGKKKEESKTGSTPASKTTINRNVLKGSVQGEKKSRVTTTVTSCSKTRRIPPTKEGMKPSSKPRETGETGVGSSKGNTLGRKTSRKSGESLQTPVIKVDRGESELKTDNGRTEESIIRELDILDNYLSQRSISIDEAASGKMTGDGTMGVDHKKVEDNVDVMESGLEAPFTKTEFKYHCPGDDNHGHPTRPSDQDQGENSTEKNINEQRDPQSTTNLDTKLNSNLEDQILVQTVLTTDRKSKANGISSKVEKPINAKKLKSVGNERNPNTSSTTTKLPGRIRKQSSLSPQRELSPPPRQPRKPVKKEEIQTDEVNTNECHDEDDDPLKPQKRGQDNSGAVLKAKSLFETKAEEAARDRSSAEFDLDKGFTKSAKVSKKAAIFEARSRGERLSISSESSINVTPGEGGNNGIIINSQEEQEQEEIRKYEEEERKLREAETTTLVPATPTRLEREKSSLTASSLSSKRSNNLQETSTTRSDVKSTTPRRGSRESPDRGGGKLKSVDPTNETKRMKELCNTTNNTTKAGGVHHHHSSTTTTTTTTGGKSETLQTQSRKESRGESPKLRSTISQEKEEEKVAVNKRRRSSTPRKNSQPGTKEASPDKTDNIQTDENKLIAHSTFSQVNSTRLTTTEFNAVDTMENIEELEQLLDKATDYDLRSKVRARIRALKRKAALVKQGDVGGVVNDEMQQDGGKAEVINVKNNERRRLSDEIQKKVTTRKDSSSELKGRVSKKEDSNEKKEFVMATVIITDQKDRDVFAKRSPVSPEREKKPVLSNGRLPSPERNLKLETQPKIVKSGRICSRDKVSPPHAVSSLIESVAASTTTQKSREMTKAEKYEADILSRPSVFCKVRGQQEGDQSKVDRETTTTNSGKVRKTPSRKNSEELEKAKKSETERSMSSSLSSTRKGSNTTTTTEENLESTRAQHQPQRKGSKELNRKSSQEVVVVRKQQPISSSSPNDSAGQNEKIEKHEMGSKIHSHKGVTTKDDQKPEDDKSKLNSTIPTRRPSSGGQIGSTDNRKSSVGTREKKNSMEESITKAINVTTSSAKKELTKTGSKSSKFVDVNNTNHTEGTESVTSSYGVGPTDDDGTPLFGLRALRKIKQAQQQIANTTTDEKRQEVEEECTTTKEGLRNSENFGLKALRKGSIASRGFDDTSPQNIESSVPRGATPEAKSEFLSSTTAPDSQSSSSTSETENPSFTKASSPKSILKKTSSFTSQIGTSAIKSGYTEESNNSDEIESGTGNSVKQEGTRTNTHATSSPESSWSNTIPSSTCSDNTTTTTSSFSRTRVGRSSVKEMSKRFESGETSSNCQTLQNVDDNEGHKPQFIRGCSPKPVTTTTTITTTTKSSVEVSGPDNNIKIELSRERDPGGEYEKEELYYPSDSDGGGSGIIRITRTVTSTTSTPANRSPPSEQQQQSSSSVHNRTFLNDQSPIQSLSDVIERMKGDATQKEYVGEFGDGQKDVEGSSSSSEGLNLLNKFIGAQVIMQAVEPMLVTKKVTMSSSALIVNGVNVDFETDADKLRQLLEEVEGEDRDRIQNRLRSLECGISSLERSPSNSSGPNKPRPLTKTLSIGGVTLGASSEGTDVTGELMPLVLGQLTHSLQSSLDTISASGSASGGGVGKSCSNISTNINNTCTNIHANSADTATTDSSSDGSNNSSSKCSSSSSSANSGEECLFDSGTESGEEVPEPQPPPSSNNAKTSPAEFSSFMEGLKNTLKRNQSKEGLLRSLSYLENAGNALSASSASPSAPASIVHSDPSIASKAKILCGEGGALGGGTSSASSSDNNKAVLVGESSSTSSPGKPVEAEADRNLITQVDKVLTLLRNSLEKDPAVLRSFGCSELELNPNSEKGKELIALIDRLRSSLSVSNKGASSSSGAEEGEKKKKESEERRDSLITKNKNKEPMPPTPAMITTCQEEKVESSPLPLGVNTSAAARAQEMLAWAQIRPPDPQVRLPWVSHMDPPPKPGEGEDHYKNRGKGRRRSHARSHTVGVTEEELAEARRWLQESAYREKQKLIEQQKQEEEQQQKKLEEEKNANNNNYVKKSESRDSLLGSTSTQGPISPELGRQSSWHSDVEKGLSNIPRPFVKSKTFDGTFPRTMSYVAPEENQNQPGGGGGNKGGSQYAKIKPFRTYSLDNAYDPSQSFFTKEETVQIAIHQAAIKKQMSEEEDRRKRRNSLSSDQNIYGIGPRSSRDLSLGLPKPYSSPQQQNQRQQKGGNGSLNTGFLSSSSDPQNQNPSALDSGYTEESGSEQRQSRNDQLVVYDGSQMTPISLSRSSSLPRTTFTQSGSSGGGNGGNNQQRIENVQISLKDLNTSEFPQLQIAITLNTNGGNNGSGSNSNGAAGNNSNNNPGANDSHFLDTQIEDVSSTTTPTSNVSSRAMRYKSKNERKRRLKRANTIDIPQTSYLSDDEDSEMEDEEDSDNTKGQGSVQSAKLSYAPFNPKNEGYRKFLSFLDKNKNGQPTNEVAKPVRSSYLAANDKFWNNRFSNLKSNFESSSQGSSPSPSPVLSRGRPASEMAVSLISPNENAEIYSRPVWAKRDRGQLPQQVKTKLQVFEAKTAEIAKEVQASHPPQPQPPPQPQHKFSQSPQPQSFRPKQFVASSSVYSTNNVPVSPPQIKPIGVQRPVAVRGSTPVTSSMSSAPPLPPQVIQAPLPHEGVHMVHATASALEAMKKSGMGPTAIVHPHMSQTRDPSPVVTSPLPLKISEPEKIELPWAKKIPLSPSEVKTRDPNAGRILNVKGKFEQLNQLEPTPPPVPPKSATVKAAGIALSQNQSVNNKIVIQPPTQQPPPPKKEVSKPGPKLVMNMAQAFDAHHNNTPPPPPPGPKPKIGTIGGAIVQSFDEVYKRRLESQPSQLGKLPVQSQPSISTPKQSPTKPETEYERVPGSAFARKVSLTESQSRRSSMPEPAVAAHKATVDRKGSDGMLIQTPVTVRVMGAAQQQKAAVASNRMSTIQDDEQSAKITNARSNIRSILNQFSQPQSNQDSKDVASSPQVLKANLQLSLPTPLSKSLSGDSIATSGGHGIGRPTSLVVGSEQLSLHSPSSPTITKQIISPSIGQKQPITSPIPSRQPQPLKPQQISPIIKSGDSDYQKPRPVIPKQKSLSEFPKIATPLTIQTDFEAMQNSSQRTPQMQGPSPRAVNKSFPAADSIQRSSSGSSIFNRAQSLFLSAQEGMLPSVKARPKPPTLAKPLGMFPKQFEAQMSPDSANKKQREVESYFKHFTQETEKKPKKKSIQYLRKSASHSKIMNRPRSFSDEEDDVDRVFESLFKASEQRLPFNRSQISRAWATSSSKSLDLSNLNEAQAQGPINFNQFREQNHFVPTKPNKIPPSPLAALPVTPSNRTSSSPPKPNTQSTSLGSPGGGNKTVPPPTPPPVAGPGVNKFKMMDQQAKANSGGGSPLFKFTNPALKASANNAKDIILYWCQCRTRDYENIKIENFSSSWSDGLAFCALIHHFFPDAFDYNSLDPRNRRYNFDLAFRVADEKAGIYPLLDTEDMIAMGRRPDWKCVFTYVQALYRGLKDL